MGALDKFLRRFGFVRLDLYGLVHTPDDRIVSTRPTVLDDGLGGKIVGWRDGDLAAMELEPWVAMGGAAPKKPQQLPKPLPLPPKPVAAKPLPGLAPVVAAPPPVVAAPPPVIAPPPVVAAPPVVQVAPEPKVEEDEWEWEIAVARARAEAADAEAAAAPTKIEPAATFPAPPQLQHEDWDERPKPVTRAPVAAAPRPAQPIRAQPSGKTIIPVPSLPVAADPRSVRPVVTPSPRRMPRATGRVEDTIRTHAAPPANEDRTSTQVTLPPAASTIGLPGARRVAAKQR